MPLSDKYAYPRVKITSDSEAWAIIKEQALYYGKTEGELIGDIAIAWTKMLKGEWNLHWPVFMANVTNNGNGAGPAPFPGNEEARRKREEDEQKQRERKEARLAAAHAELLD